MCAVLEDTSLALHSPLRGWDALASSGLCSSCLRQGFEILQSNRVTLFCLLDFDLWRVCSGYNGLKME